MTQLPLGGPDLHAHSFPNWALNPGKESWIKREGQKQNLIFMLNWEATVGQYLRCIWIKALKHIQIWKKKTPTPPFHRFFLFFSAVYIWQSKPRCLSKAERAQIKTQRPNLPCFSINYVLNVLVENGSQHAARSELYPGLNNHRKWTIPTQPPLSLWFIILQLTYHQWNRKSMASGDKWQIFSVSNY